LTNKQNKKRCLEYMFKFIKTSQFLFIIMLIAITTGCGVYKFNDVSVDPKLKTINIRYIENRAPYVNPQLSPNLTERVRQKIVNQTRLSLTNSDNAHLDVTGEIRDYSLSTTGISDKQEVTNRLTVSVHIIVNDQLNNKKQEYDISRNFEFGASLSLQQAENQLLDEMVRNLTDDIFNRMFSNW
jgi:outer membrane lipopolysaccharide assembly protein LptE/RlpB